MLMRRVVTPGVVVRVSHGLTGRYLAGGLFLGAVRRVDGGQNDAAGAFASSIVLLRGATGRQARVGLRRELFAVVSRVGDVGTSSSR